MTDGSALLAAILAKPDEDTPRLAYADWLDEQAGRLTERAEFIRNQVRYRASRGAVSQADVDRQYDLLEANWWEWLGCPAFVRATRPWLSDYREPAVNFQPRRRTRGDSYQTPITQILFVRGFASYVQCETAWWLSHADALTRTHPVEEVDLTTEVYLGLDDRRGMLLLSASRAQSRTYQVAIPSALQSASNSTTREVLIAVWPRIAFTVPPDA